MVNKIQLANHLNELYNIVASIKSSKAFM